MLMVLAFIFLLEPPEAGYLEYVQMTGGEVAGGRSLTPPISAQPRTHATLVVQPAYTNRTTVSLLGIRRSKS
jgi:hypothetical protein